MNKSNSQIYTESWISGEMKKDALDRLQADDLVRNVHAYRVKPYPEVSQDVLEYIQQRSTGVRTVPDEELNRRMNHWEYATRCAIYANNQSHILMLWAQNIFFVQGVEEQAKYLSQFVDEHRNKPHDVLTYNSAVAVGRQDYLLIQETKRRDNKK